MAPNRWLLAKVPELTLPLLLRITLVPAMTFVPKSTRTTSYRSSSKTETPFFQKQIAFQRKIKPLMLTCRALNMNRTECARSENTFCPNKRINPRLYSANPNVHHSIQATMPTTPVLENMCLHLCFDYAFKY
jgi:hypothetical protein